MLFSFAAGAIADRWDKKRTMLVTDACAALGTVTVFVLFSMSALRIWHLYIINFLISFMNAFQSPASYVATSLLAPKEQYVRVSGLHAFSGSIVTILAPALGSVMLAFGGLKSVLVFDLATFSIAFSILLLFIKIPAVKRKTDAVKESFLNSCLAGIRFLKGHTALLRIILFFAFINFIAKMGGYGMTPALILSRTGGDQAALGIVEAAIGIGTLAGSIVVTLTKPPKNRVFVIFFACGISFLIGDTGQSLTSSLPLLTAAAFASNVPMAFLNANMTAVMRTNVPVEMQGRVFSARDTIQYSTIPVSLFLGGVLADHVFEPLMANASGIQQSLSVLFGAGKGAGIAIMFFIVGMTGTITSFMCLKNPIYKTLNENQ
jgi:predicted MFS family arabinose efflux permease